MLNIVLLCQYGASTGMLVDKIMEAAKAKNIEVIVNAYPVGEVAKVIDGADIILLGPQVRFKLNSLKKDYESKNVPMITIEPTDYGRLNGENILNSILSHLEAIK
ncbi:MAG: PTS sugar transporter subunit IIB [Defluviitaleaceae bacterium]|nr:PTS sugar transporter subunit IIB [Defluviitaleaceae bacterium]